MDLITVKKNHYLQFSKLSLIFIKKMDQLFNIMIHLSLSKVCVVNGYNINKYNQYVVE